MANIRPKWVIEQIMRWERFTCCGDEDLVPLKCPHCAHIFVVCCECDSTYPNLSDLSQHMHTGEFECPQCALSLDGDLWTDYGVTLEEWCNSGYADLLQNRTVDWFVDILSQAAEAVGGLLTRDMDTTVKLRFPEFRSVSEAVAHAFPQSSQMREEGRLAAARLSRWDAVKWCSDLPDAIDRAYATLGVTESILAT